MATIVDIRSAASGRNMREAVAPARGTAEILLFTGIRYSRMTESGGATSNGAPRRLRDRLDLED